MPPNSPPFEEPPFLGLAMILHHSQHDTFSEFLTTCQENDTTLALQLASNQEPEALTCGLNHAIAKLHLELARQLILIGVQIDSNTLREASNSLDAMKLLFEFGLNVNSTMLGGGTLLRRVVRRNDEPAIRYLLAHGANPNLGPPQNSQEHFQDIRPIYNSGNALNEAAAHCTPEIFALLLDHGAVLSNSDALHRAAGASRKLPPGERIPMLKYLLGLGLDPNAIDDGIRVAEDRRGQHGSPLQYAIIWGRREEAKWLLEHGADPDRVILFGWSTREHVKKTYSADHWSSILLQDY